MWDAATGRPVSDWFVMTKRGQTGFFSPDSRLVAVCSGFSLKIHDARTGQPVAPPMPHNHLAHARRAAASAPTGRRIVTGCLDGTVRVWNTTDGKLAVPAMKHTHWNGASFSPDGRWVLSWSWSGDQTVRIWNAATGAPRCDPMRHPAPVSYAEFSPDSTRVATMCDDHAVRVWDATSGRLLLPPLWHLAPLTALQFAPMAGTCSRQARTRRCASGTLPAPPPPGRGSRS